MNTRPLFIPFRVGGPIRDPTYFAGRKEVLQQIARAMLNLQNVSLHGERRTGKTSVLLYLAHPASDVRLPETHIPVYFSFQDLAEASVADVWQAMADAIAVQIEQRHPDRQADSQRFLATTAEFLASSKAPALFGTGFGRALAQLDESGFRIHLLFDEFDQTARNPNLGDPFYDALRSLPIRAENISYVIASRTGLAALQPIYSKVSSPFFNIFTTIVLAPFREDEVHRLIFDYFARAGLDLSLAERLCAESAFLYDVTGYHPFFLQTLCYHLCAGLDKPEWPRGKAQHEALRAFETDAESHFDFYYWKVSSKEEQELVGKLATGQSVDWEALGNAAKSLEDRCLMVPAETGWQLFSSVFARWVRERQLAAWYEEGMTQLATGEFQLARRSFEKVYAIDPDYQDVHKRLEKAKRQLHLKEFYGQGEANLRKQQWQEAIEVFEELRKLEPRDGNIIIKLEEARRQFVLDDLYREGMEHFRRRRWQRAERALKRVILLASDYRDAAAMLDIARERSGRSSRVTEILRDPIWQGIGIVIAILIAVSPFLPQIVRSFVEPTPIPTPEPAILCNGDFQANLECWQHGGELVQVVACDGSQCYAVLGSPDYICEGGVPVGEAWIKQSFTVPQTVSPTLSLGYRVFSYDLDHYDFFQVSINGKPVVQTGNAVWEESSCDRGVWDSGWRAMEFDLSPYRGEILELSLHNVSTTDEWWNTWTYVDDVEIH